MNPMRKNVMVMSSTPPKPKPKAPNATPVAKIAAAPKPSAPPATTPRPAVQKSLPPAPARPATTPVKTVRTPAPMPAIEAEIEQEAPKRKFPIKTMAVIGALVLITVVLAASAFSNKTPVPTATSRAKSAVVAPGLVEPESGVLKLSFELAGKLRTVKVVEGQSVQAGEILSELENADIAARVESAKAALRLAEAQARTLEAELEAELQQTEREAERWNAELALLKAGARPEEIARAKAEVDAAQADAQRAAEDYQKHLEANKNLAGTSTGQQVDNARRISEGASARLKAVRESLGALLSGARKEEIQRAEAQLAIATAGAKRAVQSRASRVDAAKAQVATAHAQVKLAESELQKTILRAPISGVVVWKYKHTGESVGVLPPDPVVAIADSSKLRVRADVDEQDFGRVKVGQRVHVTADAFPEKKFAGRVTWLSDAAGQKRFSTGEAKEKMDVKVVETVIQLDGKCPLKLGLRVTAWFSDDQTSAK